MIQTIDYKFIVFNKTLYLTTHAESAVVEKMPGRHIENQWKIVFLTMVSYNLLGRFTKRHRIVVT